MSQHLPKPIRAGSAAKIKRQSRDRREQASMPRPFPQCLQHAQSHAPHERNVATDQDDANRYHPESEHGQETEGTRDDEEEARGNSDPDRPSSNQLEIPADRVPPKSGCVLSGARLMHVRNSSQAVFREIYMVDDLHPAADRLAR